MNTPEWMKRILPNLGNVLVMLVIVIFLGALLVGVPKLFGPIPQVEIQMGLVVVFAIGALLCLLTVMTAVFSSFGLASSNQALGLPEGSIRALIALFLIMIFVIMSVYLFRTITTEVGDGSGVMLTDLTSAQVTALNGQSANVTQNDSGTFNVTLRASVSDESRQVALQLITILGTLVTAVSAFYFGSSTAAGARASTDKPAIQADTILMPATPFASAAAAQALSAQALPPPPPEPLPAGAD